MGGHGEATCLPVCRGQADGCVGDAGMWLSLSLSLLLFLCFVGADANNLGLQHPFPHLGHFGKELTPFMTMNTLPKSFNLAYLSQAIFNQDYHFHLVFNPDCNSQTEAKSSDSG